MWYHYPGQFNYELDVSDREFTISRELHEFLLRDGGRVRAYFATHSGELLSLETLTPSAAGLRR
jgi:hypothetical protein